MKKNLLLTLSCVIALSSVSSALAMPGMSGSSVAEKVVAPVAENSVTPAAEKTAVPAAETTSPPEAEPLSGKVLQTMDSGGYTYVYIQKKDGEKVWVAVVTTPIALGTQIAFKGGMEMVNFESKSLKRKFEKIVFADAVISTSPAKVATAALPKDNEKGKSGGSKAATSTKDTKISVPKASGANSYTVQEIFAGSTKLNKKKVVVRGKVVKVSVGIMGKNWIHIQDGTGSQTKKTHNLVCTSEAVADVDDIVTVSGILAKDKDFGGGYKYNAIVEEATFQK